MQPGRRIMAVVTASMGVSFMIPHQLFAENIYHYKNRNGVSCYSNADIPEGATELSVMISETQAANIEAVRGPMDAKVAVAIEKTGAGDSNGGAESLTTILRERIERRAASIHHIENLLKTYPDNDRLRRGLYRKKQSLQEDIVRLELLDD